MSVGCDIDGCGEPVLAEGVCYDHAKLCSRCDGPSRAGVCEDSEKCERQATERATSVAHARGEDVS